MPTIPIQIPKREPLTAKMSRMINLQDAIEGRRQNQAAQDIFRNTTDPNQIQTRLRQEGLVEPYMQYAEHLARLDTEQLQQVKARNDILASQRKLLAQNIEGLIHSDPDTAKVLLPSVKKSMEVNGIPSDMLALLPDEYDPKAYQAVLNHLGEFETHQGHLDKAADTLIKQKEEERKQAAHIAAQSKAAMEKVEFRQKQTGRDPKFEAFLQNELTARGISPGSLNPQSEAQLRREVMQQFERIDDAPQSKTAQIQEYEYYAEQEKAAGRNPKGFDQWQTDDANRRKAAPGARTVIERILKGEVDEDEYNRILSNQSLARTGFDDKAIDAAVQNILNGNVSSLTAIPQAARAKVFQRLAEGGGLVLSQSDKDALKKLDSVDYLVNQLELYSRRLADDPTDVQAAFVLNGLREAATGLLSKGVFGEVGVLTDTDVKRVQAIIPGITRSVFMPGVSEAQFQELRALIGKVRANSRGGNQPRPNQGPTAPAPAGTLDDEINRAIEGAQ